MIDFGKSTRMTFQLDGVKSHAPLQWEDISVELDYEQGNIQPTINVSGFKFIREERKTILNAVESGRMYEGIPFSFDVVDDVGPENAFIGLLDLTTLKENLATDEVEVTARESEAFQTLSESLQSLSFGYLENIGIIGQSDYYDLEYVVEKKINGFEIFTTSIMLFLMLKETYEATQKLLNTIANTVSKNPLQAPFYALFVAGTQIVYSGLMVISIINLGNVLLKTFLPPKRIAKTIKLKTALEKVCSYLGYLFDSNISDLENVYYLPSNRSLDEVDNEGLIKKTRGPKSGIPYVGSYQYYVDRFFSEIGLMFKGRFLIDNNVLKFYNEFDNYWVNTSTFEMPSVFNKTRERNSQELVKNYVVSFLFDPTDSWTIDNKKGTSYEVVTDISTERNSNEKFIKGVSDNVIQASLVDRKSELNALEDLIRVVAKSIDKITDVFGKGTKFESKIKSRVALPRVSQNDYVNPKYIKLNNGVLQENHREMWGAKYLYDKYHYGTSFLNEQYNARKEVYQDVVFSFGKKDYLQLKKNSYFRTSDGRIGKMTAIRWNPAKTEASCDFWIQEKWNANIKEVSYELE